MDNIRKVTVKYNGKIVGYLAELENSKIAFQYDDEWISNGFSISPISLPLSNKTYINNKDTFGGLYGVFHDSLPDGWGMFLTNIFLQKKGINPKKLSPLTYLCLINDTGLGGLEYEPRNDKEKVNSNIDLDRLAEEAKAIYDNESFEYLEDVHKKAGSSGGSRPKAHVRINDDDWIIKFPSRLDPKNIAYLEYEANLKAKEAGLRVNDFELIETKHSSGYFAAKRFDRENGLKKHVISLSSLLETSHTIPNLDYAHLFQVVSLITGDIEEMYEAFRRMVFNVYFENKDDHGKNFSFIYDDNLNGYRLSPIYDITKTTEKFEHEMTVNGNGNPTDDDIYEIIKMFKLNQRRCDSIIEEIKEVINR